MKRLLKPNKNSRRTVRHTRVRATISGTADRPRLSVFRGLKNIVAQLIDDSAGKTLVYVSGKGVTAAAAEGKTAKVSRSFAVGQKLAAEAKAKGISRVVFDRGGYKFHGRVKAVADGARQGGLVF